MTTYPNTSDYDLEEDLTQLGTGEAMVTILSERGAPTPVVWTRMRPPRSLMAAIGEEAVDQAAKESPLWSKYAEEIDRESAREKLGARLAEAAAAEAAEAQAEAEAPAGPAPAPAPKAEPKPKAAPKGKSSKKKDDNVVVDYLKSREGRSMINTVARGLFGLLRKRR